MSVPLASWPLSTTRLKLTRLMFTKILQSQSGNGLRSPQIDQGLYYIYIYKSENKNKYIFF